VGDQDEYPEPGMLYKPRLYFYFTMITHAKLLARNIVNKYKTSDTNYG